MSPAPMKAPFALMPVAKDHNTGTDIQPQSEQARFKHITPNRCPLWVRELSGHGDKIPHVVHQKNVFLKHFSPAEAEPQWRFHGYRAETDPFRSFLDAGLAPIDRNPDVIWVCVDGMYRAYRISTALIADEVVPDLIVLAHSQMTIQDFEASMIKYQSTFASHYGIAGSTAMPAEALDGGCFEYCAGDQRSNFCETADQQQHLQGCVSAASPQEFGSQYLPSRAVRDVTYPWGSGKHLTMEQKDQLEYQGLINVTPTGKLPLIKYTEAFEKEEPCQLSTIAEMASTMQNSQGPIGKCTVEDDRLQRQPQTPRMRAVIPLPQYVTPGILIKQPLYTQPTQLLPPLLPSSNPRHTTPNLISLLLPSPATHPRLNPPQSFERPAPNPLPALPSRTLRLRTITEFDQNAAATFSSLANTQHTLYDLKDAIEEQDSIREGTRRRTTKAAEKVSRRV